jgi:hypothetical protein
LWYRRNYHDVSQAGHHHGGKAPAVEGVGTGAAAPQAPASAAGSGLSSSSEGACQLTLVCDFFSNINWRVQLARCHWKPGQRASLSETP